MEISGYASVKRVLEDSIALLPRELRDELVPTKRAYGRVCAEDVRAQSDVPQVSTSHMDGFAVRSEDAAGAREKRPARLVVVGHVGTGKKPDVVVRRGEAVRVSTGSPLPEGADAVVPLEEAHLRGSSISLNREMAKGSFVFDAGEDLRRGSVMVRKGARVTAQDVGLLISVGVKSVRVCARPRVALLATGSELTNSPSPVRGKTPNSHVPVFLLIARELGCGVFDLGIARDRRADILAKVKRGLRNADVVLTTGGTSIGALDLTEDVVKRLKPRLLYHGIRMDRGRVAGVAVVKGRPIVMMPGPIQGAMNAFVLLALPLIQRLSGIREQPFTLRATLTRRWEARKRFPNFTKVVYLRVFQARGGTVAEPLLGETESMSLLVKSNAYAIVPEEVRSMEAGQEVEALLLPGFSAA